MLGVRAVFVEAVITSAAIQCSLKPPAICAAPTEGQGELTYSIHFHDFPVETAPLVFNVRYLKLFFVNLVMNLKGIIINKEF
jgi:hypothetical protein